MPDRAGLSHLGMAAMDAAAEGITIARMTDPDAPLVYINDGFTKMTEYTYGEIIGTNCRFLQGPETNQEEVNKIRRAIATKQPVTVEMVNYTKRKTPFWNRLTLAPITDHPDTDSEYYVGVQCDITESKMVEEKLRIYAEKIKSINEAAEEQLRDFTRKISESSFQTQQNTQAMMAELKQINNDNLAKALQELQASNKATNEMIAGMKVIMENCGGMSALRSIDSSSLKIRENRLSSS